MKVTLHKSPDAVPGEAWERLGRSRTVFHELAWFRASPRPGAFVLMAARQAGRVVALLPLYRLEGPTHYYHSPKHLLCGHRERALLEACGFDSTQLSEAAEASWFPAAINVAPFGYRGGLIAASDEPATAEAAAAIAAAADDLCRNDGLKLMFHHGLCGDDDAPFLKALTARGATAFVAGAHCDLDIRWDGIGAYFESLGERGRKLRSRHRQAQQSARIRWQVISREAGSGFEREQAAEVASILASSARRHDTGEPPLDLYRALLDGWPMRRHLLVGHNTDGSLRSALIVLEKDRVLYPKFFGSEVQNDYFFLVYSRLIEFAISQGARRIAYGGGSHQAKLLRGAGLNWLLASAKFYDPGLADAFARLYPVYQAAKIEHFSGLMARYRSDRRQSGDPPAPAPAPRPEICPSTEGLRYV